MCLAISFTHVLRLHGDSGSKAWKAVCLVLNSSWSNLCARTSDDAGPIPHLTKRQHQFCNLSWEQLLQACRELVILYGFECQLGVGSRNSSFDPRSYVCVTLCQLLFTEILPRQFYQVISVTPASKIMLNCWLCFYLFFVCSVPVACLVSSYWSAIAKWLATCCMRMSHDSTQHSYRVTFTGFVEILWPDSPEFMKSEMAWAKICQAAPSKSRKPKI